MVEGRADVASEAISQRFGWPGVVSLMDMSTHISPRAWSSCQAVLRVNTTPLYPVAGPASPACHVILSASPSAMASMI